MNEYELTAEQPEKEDDEVILHGDAMYSNSDTMKENMELLHGCDYIITLDFAGGKQHE